MAFGGTAVLGLVTIAALWLALPKGAPGQRPDVRRELKVLTRPEVLLAMGTTVLGAGAMFTLYTYVAPVLAELTHASPSFVAFHREERAGSRSRRREALWKSTVTTPAKKKRSPAKISCSAESAEEIDNRP